MEEVSMKINRIVIIQGMGTDRVMLETDLPEACWPYDNKLSITFNAAQDTGPEYIALHFPNIPIEVVERSRTTPKFSEKE